jgi:hypothetical protein
MRRELSFVVRRDTFTAIITLTSPSLSHSETDVSLNAYQMARFGTQMSRLGDW